jgi:hypothetical protein
MVISLSKIVPAAHQLTTWNGQSRVRLNEFAEVRASSELPPVKQITYSAVNVLDGNSQTAWCAGKKSDGGNCYLNSGQNRILLQIVWDIIVVLRG